MAESIQFKYLKPSKYFPPSITYEGLRVIITRRLPYGLSKFQLKITDFNEHSALGVGMDQSDEYIFNQFFWFNYSEIETVRGYLDWNIDHMFVSCSEKVLNGNPIGIMCRELICRPLHYGYGFYSEEELYLDKSKIMIYEYPLKNLLEIDGSVKNLLFGWANRRLVKINGVFIEVFADDPLYANKSIFPTHFDLYSYRFIQPAEKLSDFLIFIN